MLKKIYITLLIISTLLVSLSIIRIDQKEYNYNKIIMKKPIQISKIISKEQPIGIIRIQKIDIENDLYKIESKKNNIEENITILKESQYPDQENSILFIAAHSGPDRISYFNRLDELEIGDRIEIEYNNNKYIYQVNNMYELKKDGYIRGIKEKKRQLVLTTCCPKKDNCQLIVNCIEIES